jgi:hypothetical protein
VTGASIPAPPLIRQVRNSQTHCSKLRAVPPPLITWSASARSVWISLELHEQLQLRRLETPISVIDRRVHRKRVFDVGGGHNLSESFSSSSNRELGFSMGLHGLRHGYAQRRLETLFSMGLDPLDCLEIVSPELGHLRHEITLAYTPRRKTHANNR